VVENPRPSRKRGGGQGIHWKFLFPEPNRQRGGRQPLIKEWFGQGCLLQTLDLPHRRGADISRLIVGIGGACPACAHTRGWVKSFERCCSVACCSTLVRYEAAAALEWLRAGLLCLLSGKGAGGPAICAPPRCLFQIKDNLENRQTKQKAWKRCGSSSRTDGGRSSAIGPRV